MKIKIFFFTLLAIHSSYTFSSDEQSPLIQTNNPQTATCFENGNDNVFYQRKYAAILLGSSTGGGVVGGVVSFLQPVSCTSGVLFNATSTAACFGKIALGTAVGVGGFALMGLDVGCAGILCYRLLNYYSLKSNL